MICDKIREWYPFLSKTKFFFIFALKYQKHTPENAREIMFKVYLKNNSNVIKKKFMRFHHAA